MNGAPLVLDSGIFSLNATKCGGPLDALDPRCRLLCSLAFAFAVSLLKSPVALLCASLIPLALLLCAPLAPLARPMLRLNAVALVMAVLLVLTTPRAPDAWAGLRLAALLIVRLNLISIVLLRLALLMGPGRVDAALAALGLPEKLRLLLLLTQRGIFLLANRVETSLRAVHLRAPRLRGTLKFRTFAGVAASSLIQSSTRSEHMTMALRCRGGLRGFAQAAPLTWRRRDTVLCLAFVLDIAAALALGRL
ncbi:MAG: hypothetical protein IJU98_03930 [Synergistaceae bacterium]|nr:hypothetical protein [Synergistaceae bacterium]